MVSKYSLTVLLWLATLSLIDHASAQTPAPAPQSATNDAKVEEANGVPDPELIALTWQYIRQFSGKRIKQPVWRPDGTRLTDAETNELLDQLTSFQNHWWQPEQLQPLIFVFRRETPIKSGLSVAIVRADGHRLWGGTWEPFRANGLAKSACAPQIRELPKWPEAIDLDVQVPLEDPQVIKTIDEVPDGAVEVAPGVRWYIDHDRGIEFKPGGEQRAHLTAAVLELEYEKTDDLVSYRATVWLRDKKDPLSEAYGTKIGSRPGVFTSIRVSKPLDDVAAIERVEFTRQRFKILRIEGVKLRPDFLLPPDDADSATDQAGNRALKKSSPMKSRRDPSAPRY
jgi:hypothetical protein